MERVTTEMDLNVLCDPDAAGHLLDLLYVLE